MSISWDEPFKIVGITWDAEPWLNRWRPRAWTWRGWSTFSARSSTTSREPTLGNTPVRLSLAFFSSHDGTGKIVYWLVQQSSTWSLLREKCLKLLQSRYIDAACLRGAAWLGAAWHSRGAAWLSWGAAWLSWGAAWLSWGAAWLSGVRRGSLGCGVAQLVARRLAVRRPRVRILARHPREVPATELFSDDGNGEEPRRMFMDVECVNVLYVCKKNQ